MNILYLYDMNIFVPYNIESRKQKHKQANLKMLQNEIIECNLFIDETFNFKTDQVKVQVIKGDVYLSELGYIPEWLRDVKIEGYFGCNGCNLTSLKNCPQHIMGGFNCSNNQLTSMIYGPKYVGGDFVCCNNLLSNFDQFPQILYKSIYISFNNFSSLNGIQQLIYGTFDCSHNKLINLIGAPKRVEENYYCNNNKIQSLEGFPLYVGKFLDISYNQITDFNHKYIDNKPIILGNFHINYNVSKVSDDLLNDIFDIRGSIYKNNIHYTKIQL